RLPSRKQLNGIVSAASPISCSRPAGPAREELAQVVGEPLRLRRGRHPNDQRAPSGQPGQAGQEEGPGGLGYRDEARRAAGQGGKRRVVSEQGRKFGESHGVRAATRRSSATG